MKQAKTKMTNDRLNDKQIKLLKGMGKEKSEALTALCFHIQERAFQKGIAEGRRQERENILKFIRNHIEDGNTIADIILGYGELK